MRAVPWEPCLGLIHEFEKGPEGTFSATPYRDPAGHWTNGWGHRCSQGAPPITAEQADQQARIDLSAAANGVCTVLGDPLVEMLTEGQYAALIDFTFNEGMGRFAGSTLAHYIKVGAMHLVPGEFRRWIYSHVNGVATVEQGLVRRRNTEIAVWLA